MSEKQAVTRERLDLPALGGKVRPARPELEIKAIMRDGKLFSLEGFKTGVNLFLESYRLIPRSEKPAESLQSCLGSIWAHRVDIH